MRLDGPILKSAVAEDDGLGGGLDDGEVCWISMLPSGCIAMLCG